MRTTYAAAVRIALAVLFVTTMVGGAVAQPVSQESDGARPRSPIGWALGGLDAVLTTARAQVITTSGSVLSAISHSTLGLIGLDIARTGAGTTVAEAAAGLQVRRVATGGAGLEGSAAGATDGGEPSRQQTRRRHGAVLAGSGTDAEHHVTLGYLIEEAGFEVDTVVEGLNPFPFYCVAFEQTAYKSREERQRALDEIGSYFALRRQQAPWYDFWTGWEEWAVTAIADADADLSRFAAMMGLRLEGVDVHLLPLPSTEIDFHSGEDVAMADYEPPSRPAELINKYGYHIVFIEEGLGLEGPETKILLRKTKLLSAEESHAVRAEIEAWLSEHPDGWSFNYFWDRLFFKLLIGVEDEAINLGKVQDLMLHDIIIKLSVLPNVTTRLRHQGKPIEHYPPPPCA